ncbi:cytochrome c biogenesis protein ResB [Blastococcus sp. CT_GayMR16]|uniref:cytochrome c biogenesis protein ResB n=1 Tax=Blastococcus sp. CT_GayMR16 TaxID=2559607 RepID=UPI001073EB4B|nr:cytochrome c biogenesis protein ResB [Blastococcus sp. CT_GayMR16]TFV91132.1 hypothetical protein E4P38_00515 [Blastococcus sp. CT_GayMR16]
MRTAIILLFLLALAAVPDSLLPQRSLSPSSVAMYYRDHPGLAPVLDRMGMFEVFSSPWFAAVYLLLFTSLLGCLLPRTTPHAPHQPRLRRDAARLLCGGLVPP